jgi:hypothetical protein
MWQPVYNLLLTPLEYIATIAIYYRGCWEWRASNLIEDQAYPIALPRQHRM